MAHITRRVDATDPRLANLEMAMTKYDESQKYDDHLEAKLAYDSDINEVRSLTDDATRHSGSSRRQSRCDSTSSVVLSQRRRLRRMSLGQSRTSR